MECKTKVVTPAVWEKALVFGLQNHLLSSQSLRSDKIIEKEATKTQVGLMDKEMIGGVAIICFIMKKA